MLCACRTWLNSSEMQLSISHFCSRFFIFPIWTRPPKLASGARMPAQSANLEPLCGTPKKMQPLIQMPFCVGGLVLLISTIAFPESEPFIFGRGEAFRSRCTCLDTRPPRLCAMKISGRSGSWEVLAYGGQLTGSQLLTFSRSDLSSSQRVTTGSDISPSTVSPQTLALYP